MVPGPSAAAVGITAAFASSLGMPFWTALPERCLCQLSVFPSSLPGQRSPALQPFALSSPSHPCSREEAFRRAVPRPFQAADTQPRSSRTGCWGAAWCPGDSGCCPCPVRASPLPRRRPGSLPPLPAPHLCLRSQRCCLPCGLFLLRCRGLFQFLNHLFWRDPDFLQYFFSFPRERQVCSWHLSPSPFVNAEAKKAFNFLALSIFSVN